MVEAGAVAAAAAAVLVDGAVAEVAVALTAAAEVVVVCLLLQVFSDLGCCNCSYLALHCDLHVLSQLLCSEELQPG